MEEFDTGFSYSRVKRNQLKHNNVKYDTCEDCNIIMKKSESLLVCPDCGNQKNYFDMETNFSYNHNTGPSANKVSFKPSMRGTSKVLIVYPTYELMKEGKTTREFNQLKYENMSMSPHIIDEAKILYNKFITSNNITKKTGKKEGIYQGCIWFVCAKHDEPRTKLELSKKYNIEENKISTGIGFLTSTNDKYDLGLTIYKNHDLIDGFINRFSMVLGINVTPNLKNFFKNMAHNIKNNSIVHKNKNPECIAAGIILFGKDMFNYDAEIEVLIRITYTSNKNIKQYYLFLNTIKDTPTHPLNKSFNIIINKFSKHLE